MNWSAAFLCIAVLLNGCAAPKSQAPQSENGLTQIVKVVSGTGTALTYITAGAIALYERNGSWPDSADDIAALDDTCGRAVESVRDLRFAVLQNGDLEIKGFLMSPPDEPFEMVVFREDPGAVDGRLKGRSQIRFPKREKGPNQALQTTPMTRSVYEKTIEFGHPQRGV